MENPKQYLTESQFFEEENKILRTALFITIPIVVGAVALFVVRTLKNIEKES